jgi:hypothetical protein
LIPEFPDDADLHAELKRLGDELDAAREQRDEHFAALQRERKARSRLTRLIQDALNEEGLW